jgi:hypothetical protein
MRNIQIIANTINSMYYVKGTRGDEEFYYYGPMNPYNITQQEPSGFAYSEWTSAQGTARYLNRENQFSKIQWTVVDEDVMREDRRHYYLRQLMQLST